MRNPRCKPTFFGDKIGDSDEVNEFRDPDKLFYMKVPLTIH